MQRFIQCDGSRENMVGGAEGMTILDVEGWWIPEKMFIDVTKRLYHQNCVSPGTSIFPFQFHKGHPFNHLIWLYASIKIALFIPMSNSLIQKSSWSESGKFETFKDKKLSSSNT